MNLFRLIRLYSECFKIAKFTGLTACSKYLCGALVLPDLDSESSVFPDGDFYV